MTEQMFCPYCGAENSSTDKFCITCGANLHTTMDTIHSSTKQADQTYTPVKSYSFQEAFNAPHIAVLPTEEKLQENKITPKVIISFIMGIISLFFFSWGIWFLQFRLWYLVLFSTIFTFVGIILSATSIKNHKILGILGVVFNAISFLDHVIVVFLLILYFLLF